MNPAQHIIKPYSKPALGFLYALQKLPHGRVEPGQTLPAAAAYRLSSYLRSSISPSAV
jgi:hypothetical protein